MICGALSDRSCWCEAEAPRIITPALAGCLCPACLVQQPLTALNITPIADHALAARVAARLDQQTKPPGSLGALEATALRIALIQQSDKPQLMQPQVVVFAGDHGLARDGVSAYPQDVTWQMVENFLAGGAAVSVLARQHGLDLTVVDAGVAHDFTPRSSLQLRKVAAGTASSLHGAAMSAAQCAAALLHGREAVASLPGNAVLIGEMGIGNTSAATLIMHRLLGLPLAQCTGRGTGLDEAGLARKLALLERAAEANAAAQEPLDVLAAFGGFEMAQMVGAYWQAAYTRRVIVVDGFIATAALLVAARIAPAVLDYCVFAHCSNEAGHAALLNALNATPLLKLDMRLGEASGAVAAWPLVISAVKLFNEMATFESAGVASASPTAIHNE
jgi:nicotinate-nucleotide--dimethylbenzimidazole phosphoribosyltransferase